MLYYMNDKKLKEMDVTNQQGRLLEIIYDNILAGHAITRHFLEEVMDLRGPTITSLLNGLEKKEYIIRTVSNEDHRAMKLIITPKGEKVLEDIRKIFNDILCFLHTFRCKINTHRIFIFIISNFIMKR